MVEVKRRTETVEEKARIANKADRDTGSYSKIGCSPGLSNGRR